ncbi:MAG: hypothetical protein GEU80_13705 [Dehalococcoidia bacterium]|nr:hypothetical protein [Dehalococcoidia bacterium]
MPRTRAAYSITVTKGRHPVRARRTALPRRRRRRPRERPARDRAGSLGSARLDPATRREGEHRDRTLFDPADNPFVGEPNVRPEIWAYGLRNPWRMAFDAETGRLWVGDVGQHAVEEVNVVRRGANYGWSAFEGDSCFKSGCAAVAEEATRPVATYTHEEGCSVTGGLVYRGTEVPTLAGDSLFADLCSGVVWARDAESGRISQVAAPGGPLVSFGLDARGKAYVLRFGAPILRLIGR